MKRDRAKSTGWLLAGLIFFQIAQGAERLSVSREADPGEPAAKTPKKELKKDSLGPVSKEAPKVAPINRKELPAAFTKTVPASIADLKAMEQRVTNLVHRLSPSVVDVQIGNGSGSGVIISPDGLVLTAGHVAGEAKKEARLVFPDGKAVRGKTLGANHDSDTGLIRITDPGTWPCAPVGDLKEARLGDWVLALGNPGGFDAKRSLVVRLGRIVRLGTDILQTDCTIEPGDSGGPLFDMYGRVIGIHTSIGGALTANFHVPITEFRNDWAQLVSGADTGQPASPKAYVGASGVDVADGVELRSIEADGPASKAGLKAGDLVLRVDGRDIKVAASFQRWIEEAAPGETLNFEVKRGSKTLSLDVKLEALPSKTK